MRKGLVGITVLLAALSLTALGKSTFWLPRGDSWTTVYDAKHNQTGANFKDETVEVFVGFGTDALGPFASGLTIKNLTKRELVFYLSRCYFKTSNGIVKEPMPASVAADQSGRTLRRLGGYEASRELGDMVVSMYFSAVEIIPPDTAKSGQLMLDRNWFRMLPKGMQADFGFHIDGIFDGETKIRIPPVRFVKTQVELKK